MMTRFVLVALLALPGSLGGSPWDKVPTKWNLADVSRILQDSPWSPARVKLDREFTSRRTDPQTGMVTDTPLSANSASRVSGIQISRSKPLPKVPVIWWSSKTVRLAKQRLRVQLRTPGGAVDLDREEVRSIADIRAEGILDRVVEHPAIEEQRACRE